MGAIQEDQATLHFPSGEPRPLYTPPPPKKEEPVRVAAVQTGAAMVSGGALVLLMKHVFQTDLSVEDALIIVSAVSLVANWLSGEVARLKVVAPEKGS